MEATLQVHPTINGGTIAIGFSFNLGLQNPEHHSCQAAAPCDASLIQVEEDLNSPGRDATEKATLGYGV